MLVELYMVLCSKMCTKGAVYFILYFFDQGNIPGGTKITEITKFVI